MMENHTNKATQYYSVFSYAEMGHKVLFQLWCLLSKFKNE